MSKRTEELASKLVPTSKAPREEQYKIAWNLLLHLPESDEWHKAQAKCWLTYRVFDGQVKLEDWEKQIAPVRPKPTSWMKTRWDVSQATAETWMLCKHHPDPMQGPSMAYKVYAMETRLHEYPPCILNWLRVVTLLAVRKWLSGKDKEATNLIEAGVSRWREITSSFHWRTHPTRFTEMMGDTWALSVLTLLAQRLGITKNMPDRDWMSPAIVAQRIGKEPWVECLKELRGVEGRIFFP